ncbi:mannose-6-phosphate isomerase, class I [Shouchella shacheensis]|uniref:mannose-6-phosphate isomerase, class I n=1 Tax=Shouchella shacheensis TaxID=1649580 RepID=UPI000A6BA1BA|nr:mannose-6-phosphate isomerase, class I [Shouchella shacheensis]
MANEPIFFEPLFQYRVWGGQKLKEFGYSLPYERTGECWAISAHQNGVSVVKHGTYEGQTLDSLWKNEAQLFGEKTTESFPLLVKLLDARDDLSVQVHPNDEQAQQLESNEAYGKTECWYVVDAEEGAELILGHTAKTREEFEIMVEAGQWEELLTRVPIQAGDFYYVPSGTIHAIGAGALILETQQNSDTTYRVYDFDRVEPNGEKRELHLDKAIEVSAIPHAPAKTETTISKQEEGGTVTQLVSTDFFTVDKIEVDGELTHSLSSKYSLASVIEGEGSLLTSEGTAFEIQKGDHFLLPNGMKEFKTKGRLEFIVSHP